MNIGFSGTKLGMRYKQGEKVHDLLSYLKRNRPVGEEAVFHHGDCVGADDEAARIAWELGFTIHCHPPIKENKRAFFPHNDLVNPPFDFIVRDQHIVDDSRILIAAPHTNYEITRSGTWTTVRYARSLKRKIFIVHPDGSVHPEN